MDGCNGKWLPWEMKFGCPHSHFLFHLCCFWCTLEKHSWTVILYSPQTYLSMKFLWTPPGALLAPLWVRWGPVPCDHPIAQGLGWRHQQGEIGKPVKHIETASVSDGFGILKTAAKLHFIGVAIVTSETSMDYYQLLPSHICSMKFLWIPPGASGPLMGPMRPACQTCPDFPGFPDYRFPDFRISWVVCWLCFRVVGFPGRM